VTKSGAQILGEKLVLAANGREGTLATVALRPSGIFGEGDPLLVPLTVANAKKGKMKYVIGSGENLMDFTYVGNVAQAHLLVCASTLAHLALQSFPAAYRGPPARGPPARAWGGDFLHW
jgi:sterol-4alpha-carboxylate 3-dehydrogenase (decarboxylating)